MYQTATWDKICGYDYFLQFHYTHFINHHLAKKLRQCYRDLCCHQRKNLYRVQIKTGMKLIETIGLYDTGNRLYEPIRKKPVSIIGKELAMRLLEGEQEWGRRFRLIPYSSIGVENGLMKGFVADELVVFVNRYSFVYAHPVLAVAEQSFGKRDGYEIILHPDMI